MNVGELIDFLAHFHHDREVTISDDGELTVTGVDGVEYSLGDEVPRQSQD